MIETFLSAIESIRQEALDNIIKKRQIDLGQFLTPLPVARSMATMFSFREKNIHLLDAGAGAGTLTAALIARLVEEPEKPTSIDVVLYEIDPYMIQRLHRTMAECKLLCNRFNIEFNHNILEEDFISASVASIQGSNSLFPVDTYHFNYAILNPP